MLSGLLVVTMSGSSEAGGDEGRDFGRMGPSNARTTSVSPSAGPDFELPFLCAQRWTGSTRSRHSPSSNTVDFNAPGDLNKPVVASAPGVVIRAVSLTGSYGRYVIVDHGGGYTTLYAHLNKISSAVGQVVDQGELVGYLGSSGNSTGPHLHFEQRLDGAYLRPYFHRSYFTFGSTVSSLNCNDRPVVGDWDKDRVDDVGVFRARAGTATFHLRTSAATQVLGWGNAGDVPFAADYDGDQISQVGVRKLGQATWWLRSRTGVRATVTGVGAATDAPINGDWDGNGRANLGFYRASTHTFYLRGDDHRLTAVRWGADGDEPVTGDWNGDGRDDIGAFNHRTGYWTLRVPTASGVKQTRIRYGNAGDRAAPGDWDGNGTTEPGVWRPSNGNFYKYGATRTRFGAVRG